ncbi:hypothetical protein BH11PLA2_BH11PLA2_45890 [soil metagenome]
MTPEMLELLRGVDAEQRLIEADTQRPAVPELRYEFSLCHDFGPRIDLAAWFGVHFEDGAGRKRYQRAATKLLELGLLENLRPEKRIGRVKITPAGRAYLAAIPKTPRRK